MAMKFEVPTLRDDLAIHDWLGAPCARCGGDGESEYDQCAGRRACSGCGGTGEGYGLVMAGPNTEGRVGKGARILGVVK